MHSVAWILFFGWLSTGSNAWLLPRPKAATRRTKICTTSSLPSSTTKEQPVLNDLDLVRDLTEKAILHKAEPEGLQALEHLGLLCARRRPFDFERTATTSEIGSVLQKIPSLLSVESSREVLDQVQVLVDEGYLSTNEDSVDGLPSFHWNLVSGGEPLNDDDGLLEVLRPSLYEDLLPRVRQVMQSETVQVDEVFVRRYGQDMMEGKSRLSLSAHFDIYSIVTAVIALDDVAVDGENGLYTVTNAEQCSNHASLRRFFPLACGDSVVHSWDVMHGVDVEPGLDRTSLIVWFIDTKEHDTNTDVSPWLTTRDDFDTNSVAQFVLASAIQSVNWTPDGVDAKQPTQIAESTTYTQDDAIEYYCRSAALGNTFATSCLGGLCADGRLSTRHLDLIEAILNQSQTKANLPACVVDGTDRTTILAKRLWYASALMGNARAQISLADELMTEASDRDDREAMQVAAVFFALAAQQGESGGVEALDRLVGYVVQNWGIASEDDFAQCPIVQISQAACLYTTQT